MLFLVVIKIRWFNSRMFRFYSRCTSYMRANIKAKKLLNFSSDVPTIPKVVL